MTASAGAGRATVHHLHIERRGGMAGLHASAERDGADLTPAQRQAIDKLRAVPAAPPASAGADRFRYRVAITDADGAQTVIDVAEDTMPAALATLVKPKLP